jgi:hypothetical protein
MTSTYEKIATHTITTNVASYTFTSIPGTYTDLVLIIGNGEHSDASQTTVQFNSDTGSNYSRTALSATGGSNTSVRATSATSLMLEWNGYPSVNGNKDYTGVWNFMNYANTTTYKTIIGRGNSVSTGVVTSVGLWRSTSAITSIKLQPSNTSFFMSYGVYTLYGIKAE